jgi:hypothetical protein
MAKVRISDQKLDIQIGVLEAIQALQPSFSIKLENVRGATEDSGYIKSGLGFRSPGTGFPGLVAKGTFRKPGQRVLSLWNRGQEVVVIELNGSKWNRIILGCDDARKLVNQINSALNG